MNAKWNQNLFAHTFYERLNPGPQLTFSAHTVFPFQLQHRNSFFAQGAHHGHGVHAPEIAELDNFNDNTMGPMWTLMTPPESVVWLDETNQRLEARATGNGETEGFAVYAPNGWHLDTSQDFGLRIQYHFELKSRSWSELLFALGENPSDIKKTSYNILFAAMRIRKFPMAHTFIVRLKTAIQSMANYFLMGWIQHRIICRAIALLRMPSLILLIYVITHLSTGADNNHKSI